jgi:hypothetical protein
MNRGVAGWSLFSGNSFLASYRFPCCFCTFLFLCLCFLDGVESELSAG